MFMLMCTSFLLLFMVDDKLNWVLRSWWFVSCLIVGIGNNVVLSHRRTVQIICAGCNYIMVFNSYCPVCSSDVESDDFFQHCIWLWNLPMIFNETPPLRILSLINLNKHDSCPFSCNCQTIEPYIAGDWQLVSLPSRVITVGRWFIF